jgi:redox-sensitive bicupin YhaK (pirin superfamily)
MKSRILNQYPAYRDDIDDLITRRPVPGPGLDQLDPFLFLNHHGPQVCLPGNQGLPFGPHPHRGFETVTFILEGELAHLDSGGNESIIKAGGVQWMTAGAGLVHAELSPASFKRSGGALEILQLWVNLPASLKMVAPAYIGLQHDQIPAIAMDQGRCIVNLISGDFQGCHGPIESLTGVTMMTVSMQPGASVKLPTPEGQQVLFYVVNGDLEVEGETAKAHHLIDIVQGAELITLRAHSQVMVLYGFAKPIGEPVVSHGPFVMNSREEIAQAIQDYQSGMFGTIPDSILD